MHYCCHNTCPLVLYYLTAVLKSRFIKLIGNRVNVALTVVVRVKLVFGYGYLYYDSNRLYT